MRKLKELEQIITKQIENGAFPGCCYAIITPSEIYTNCLGNKRIVPFVEPNTIDTMYDLASVTKVTSTTTAILKLYEDKKIDFNKTVNYYLPRFKHTGVKVINLINHTSGLPAGIYGVKNLKSKKEVIDSAYEIDLIYEVGSKILYSDINYILLGMIVEEITGKSLDIFVGEIFQNLEMFDTCYNPKDKIRCAPTEDKEDELYRGVIQGRVHDETAYLLEGVSGNAGLFSTISDMSKFAQMYLNKGQYKDKKILKESTIDMILNYKISYVNEEKGCSYIRTIGWLIGGVNEPIGKNSNTRTIHHTGFTGTNIFIDFENSFAFCLLTNRVHPTRSNLKISASRKEIADFIYLNRCFE